MTRANRLVLTFCMCVSVCVSNDTTPSFDIHKRLYFVLLILDCFYHLEKGDAMRKKRLANLCHWAKELIIFILMVYQACKKMRLKTWIQIVAVETSCHRQIIQSFHRDHRCMMGVVLAKVAIERSINQIWTLLEILSIMKVTSCCFLCIWTVYKEHPTHFDILIYKF